MQSLFSTKPELKEKHIPYTISITILALTSVVLLMLPVIVNILNRFSTIDTSLDIVYYILKGLFGLSIAVGITIYVLKKNVTAVAIPCLFGFITVLFPLYESVTAFTNAYSMAQQLSMSVGYGPYLIDIGEHLIYALLCLFTLMFSIGRFRYILIIMLLSVIGSLSTIFTCVDKYITYDISVYEILSFGYAAVACLIPLLLVLSVNSKDVTKREKYKARRMK